MQALIALVAFPSLLGLSQFLRDRKVAAIYYKLSEQGVDSFKSKEDLEHILGLIMDYLLSKDPRLHNKF
jgi:hypothetical protein